MERPDIRQRRRGELGDGLVGRGNVERVALRLVHELAQQRELRDDDRLGLYLLELRDVLLLQLVELRRVEARTTELLRDELQYRQEVVAYRLDRRHDVVAAGRYRHLGLELVERVLHLLARQRRRAAREHPRGELRRGDLAGQRLFGANAHGDLGDHLIAPRLLGEQRELRAIGQDGVRRACIDVAR